jgi:hypothetical protein
MGVLLTLKKPNKGSKISNHRTVKTVRRTTSIKRDFVILTKEEVEKDRSSAYAYVVTA